MTGLLTLAGLIVVALITAYTTDKRLGKQIIAERERQRWELDDAGKRQQRALDAEAVRQMASLGHARSLADLQHLREVFDEAAGAYEEARERLSELAAFRGTAKPLNSKLLTTKNDGAWSAAQRVAIEARRLEIRFAPDHEVPLAYDGVSKRALALQASLGLLKMKEEQLDEDGRQEFVRGMVGLDAAFARFARAARVEVGVAEQRAASNPSASG